MALMICVRWPTSRSRVRNTTADACLASLLTATNRMVGRWAASQIASASAALFFCIVLLPLDERLHVSRRNQPHLVPQLGDLACPVVSARARLHGDKTAGLRGEEGEHLIAPQPLAEQDSAGGTCPMCLEHVLGQIQSDRANFCHGRLPSSGCQHHHFGTSMPSGGVHSISGPEAAATLWSEGLFRTFNNRKQVAAYAGLAPTPWQSGSVHRDQGVSKAGNPRLRTTMIQIAWLWLRHQPQSALTVWFRERIKRTGGRLGKTTTVALARKLLVALWKYATAGVLIEGAVLKPA